MSTQQKSKMNTDIKVFIGVVIIGIIGFVLIIANMLKPEDVAVVGRSNISNDEFMYYYSQNVSEVLKQKDPYTSEADFLNQSYGQGTVADMVKQQTLNEVIQINILLQNAKKDGFKANNKEVNDEWLNFKNSLLQEASSLGMSLQEYSKAAFGLSINKVEKTHKDLIRSQKYMESKIDEITVDEAQLREFYDKYKNQFDSAVVRHILVTCAEEEKDDVIAEKKNIAEGILERVNKGEDFSELAKEFSEDPGSKDNGGKYEIKPSDSMVPEFIDWTFSHKAGDTGIIKTTYGFHIMKLDEISNTFEQQGKDLEYGYKSSEYSAVMNEYFNNGEYPIEIKNGYNNY